MRPPPEQLQAIIRSLPINSNGAHLEDIAEGRSHYSYRLRCADGDFVLRLKGPGFSFPGVDPVREQKVLALAARESLAPQVIHNDPEQGVLLSVWIPPCEAGFPQVPGAEEQMLALVSQVHALPCTNIGSLRYVQYLEAYQARCRLAGIDLSGERLQRRENAMKIAARLDADTTRHGLCHHDPGLQNLRRGPDGLLLVDWEYAARGHQFHDLAVLHVDCGMSLERFDLGADAQVLMLEAVEYYRYLCELWGALERAC